MLPRGDYANPIEIISIQAGARIRASDGIITNPSFSTIALRAGARGRRKSPKYTLR
jgi:hypothetical protein